MGVLMMIVTAIGGVFGAVALGLMKDEATAWLPSLNKLVLGAAVRRVPKDKRERYAEEWASHVAEYPGKLSQLMQCLRCFHAGSTMEELSAKHVDRMMSLMVVFAGVGMMSGLLIDKYRDLNIWMHHLVNFIDFAANVQVTWMMVWFIWRRPQVVKALRGGLSDPPMS